MPPEAGAAAHFRALESLYAAAPINALFESRLSIPEAGVARIDFAIESSHYHAGGAAHGTSYFKMLDVPGIEIVILGAPPAFRPRHLDACIKAGKHVFAEKPIAVDPQGVRHVLECTAAAKAKQLTLVTGTQRRHQGAYMRQALAFQKGQLGTIRGGNIYWCQARGSIRPRKEGVTNALKYAPPGTPCRVALAWRETELEVAVVDSPGHVVGAPPQLPAK